MLGECAVSSWSQYTGAQSSRGGVYPRPKKGKPRDSSTLACSMERFAVRKKIRLPLLVYSLGHPFFITVTTHRKHPWFALHPRLCKAAIQILRDLASVRETSIYAWCIMPGHAHLLLQDDEVVEFIRMFKGRMTPAARKIESDRRFWQRSFFDHALRKEESLSDVACYIWENPVRATLVESPREYPWSGSEVWPEWRRFYERG